MLAMRSDISPRLTGKGALFLIALIGVIHIRVVSAQQPAPVQWSARAPAGDIRPGTTSRVTVIADIAPDWHVYSLTQPDGGPTAMTIHLRDTTSAKIVGAVRGPSPRVERQSAFDVPVELYDGRSEFTVPIRLDAPASGKTPTIRLVVTWQSCSSSICLPPRSIELPVDVGVATTR